MGKGIFHHPIAFQCHPQIADPSIFGANEFHGVTAPENPRTEQAFHQLGLATRDALPLKVAGAHPGQPSEEVSFEDKTPSLAKMCKNKTELKNLDFQHA